MRRKVMTNGSVEMREKIEVRVRSVLIGHVRPNSLVGPTLIIDTEACPKHMGLVINDLRRIASMMEEWDTT